MSEQELLDRKEKRRRISELFIFSWLPERNTMRTLVAFGIFSVMIHFLGFYLFKVAYPEPVRSELLPDQIVVLDSSNADVRQFLERVGDRNVFLKPASRNAASRVKLSDHAIRFVPSFSETRPNLIRRANSSDDLRIDIPEPETHAFYGNWKNPVEFSPNLIKRGISPGSIFDDYLDFVPNLPKIRVSLTVSPDGYPIQVHVSGDSSEEDKILLISGIQSTLRFNPTPEEEGNDPGWMKLGVLPESP